MKKVRIQSFKESIRKTFTVYALIPSLVFTIVAFLIVVFILLGSVQSRTRNIANQITQGLEEMLTGYMQELNNRSKKPEVVHSVKKGNLPIEQYSEMYRYINSQEMRCNFYIVDSAGQILASSVNTIPEYIEKPPIFNVGIIRKINSSPDKVCVSVENNIGQNGKVLTLGTALCDQNNIVGMLIYEFEESLFLQRYVDISSTNIVFADGQDYVCWTTDHTFTNSYGKLDTAFQKQNTTVSFGDARFFTQYRPLLSGELHLYTMSEVGVYYGIFGMVAVALVAVFVVLAFSIMLASREVAGKKTQVIEQMVNTMQYARSGDFSHPLSINTGDEFEIMAETYNKMLQDIQQLIYDKEEFARQNVISEIKQLESQFDPHFLFNTLELIKYMTKIAPDDANKVIVGFSSLLRESINNTVSEVSLEQDWEYTKNYLMIQKYRFGDKLSYETELSSEAMRCTVPKRVLQPIVENALNYGRNNEGCCRLHIKAWVKRKQLVIEIGDEGAGIAPNRIRELNRLLRQRKNTSVHNGLYNVHRRIDLIYGPPYGISIKSQSGVGTQIMIKLPARMEEKQYA